MGMPTITTVEELRAHLHVAMQLEHGTLPPYLTALYSIQPETNSEARHILRVAVVEEMLHLTLAANVLNAVGGRPDLTAPGFVPEYPAYLPDGEDDFEVSRQGFSRECVETVLWIERPRRAPDESRRLLDRKHHAHTSLVACPTRPGMRFYSIGEFYRAIAHGLRRLHEQMGDELFSGDPARQITREYFYSGGGDLVRVTDLASALRALDLIAEQGEGYGGGIFDREHELAHFYRFQQLVLGRYYQKGDTAGHPTGPPIDVDWDAAYPVKKDARLADYPENSELWEAAREFNRSYSDLLDVLTRTYNGRPDLLTDAVVEMFRLRDQIVRLVRNPIPGQDGLHAAPTFEVAPRAATVAS